MVESIPQNTSVAPAQKTDTGMWMGILALAGILCLSIIAVSFVFMVRDRGGVVMSTNPALPVIVNNIIPSQQKDNPQVEWREAGKQLAGATRAPADANYINAIPGKLATPTPIRGQRKVMVQRADPSPPPYEKPAQISGFAIRRGNPGPSVLRGPLPNRIGAASGGTGGTFSPRYALPGQVPAGTSFSSTPDQSLSVQSASSGSLSVSVSGLRFTSQPLAPYGYRPLQGHEFLVADVSVSNLTDEEVVLDEGSIWASDASDPDLGYMQNIQLSGADFPRTLGAGENQSIRIAIVVLSNEPPIGLVVQPPQGRAVQLPFRH